MSDAQKIVDDWNARHPVGTLVEVFRQSTGATRFRAKTSSEAFVFFGKQPVVKLAGKFGSWALALLEVVEAVDE